jgi:murein DD-endopeptidase MepM/ murein hydrolase activator NlpD
MPGTQLSQIIRNSFKETHYLFLLFLFCLIFGLLVINPINVKADGICGDDDVNPADTFVTPFLTFPIQNTTHYNIVSGKKITSIVDHSLPIGYPRKAHSIEHPDEFWPFWSVKDGIVVASTGNHGYRTCEQGDYRADFTANYPNLFPHWSESLKNWLYYDGHNGIDYGTTGNAIAAAPGYIEFAGKLGCYGNTVIIDHWNGYRTQYSHLASINPELLWENNHYYHIQRGEFVGQIGNTYFGTNCGSTGVHLHFGVYHLHHNYYIDQDIWYPTDPYSYPYPNIDPLLLNGPSNDGQEASSWLWQDLTPNQFDYLKGGLGGGDMGGGGDIIYWASQVSNYAPASVSPNQIFNAWIRVRNDGLASWEAGSAYKLENINNTSFGNSSTVELTHSVLDGDEYTWNFTFKAPAQTGTYYSTWVMKSGNFIISDPLSVTIRVTSSGEYDTTLPSGYFTAPASGTVVNSRVVTISVDAIDNPGGSGVKEVRFSAKWGNEWYGIGNVSTAPYTFNWDMCNSSVPDGDIELGMEVWDNANNKYVWSEHGTNPHITKNFSCNDGDPVAGGPWNTHAWQNKYLAGYTNWEGTLTWANEYPYIWLDWGSGAPFGWGGDEFSMRIWRNVYFPGGYYDFHADHDDGVKVFVDGHLVIDAWWDSNGGHDGGKTLSSGYHEVKVEYYENRGDALVHVLWYGPGYPRPDTQPPTGRITSPTHMSATNQNPLSIWAEASDDVSGVKSVKFLAWYCHNNVCEWRVLNTATNAPYNCTWDWSSIGNKHVWLTIHVEDNTGKITYDPGGWVEVDIDNSSPVVEISSPLDSSYINQDETTIYASAYDNESGIKALQFFAGYVDDSLDYWHQIGWDENGDDGWSFTWQTALIPDQTDISFFIYAYDLAGNYSGTASWNNVLDRISPSSSINHLSPSVPETFLVSWNGRDETSGVESYDIQYKENSGPWVDWKVGINATYALFSGIIGNTYEFRGRSKDYAGNVEDWPLTAETFTKVEYSEVHQPILEIYLPTLIKR